MFSDFRATKDDLLAAADAGLMVELCNCDARTLVWAAQLANYHGIGLLEQLICRACLVQVCYVPPKHEPPPLELPPPGGGGGGGEPPLPPPPVLPPPCKCDLQIPAPAEWTPLMKGQ